MKLKETIKRHKKVTVLICVILAAFFIFLFWRTGTEEKSQTQAQKTVQLKGFRELKAAYSGDVYEGDRFDESRVTVTALGDGDKTQEITTFDWDGADSIGGKTSYMIYTSYGETTLTIDPVPVQSCVAEDGNYYAGTEFSGTIDLTYTDGTVRGIKSSDVEFPNGSTLQVGENQIPFTWQGCSHTLYVNAAKESRISSAKTKYKEELNQSVYNSVTDKLFMTVSKKELSDGGAFYLTHIVLSSPTQLKIGTANNMIGSYRDLSEEASETGWILGMTVGTSTENSAFGYGKTAVGYTSGCVIRGGKTVVNGSTTGNEVCLTDSGALFSPPAGLTADQLLGQGVTDTVESVMPLLLQDGTEYAEGSTSYDATLPASAVGMVEPGEYYFLTSDAMGLSCADMQSILSDAGCTFARAMGSGASVGLYYRTTPILESTEAAQDFIYLIGA